jgi:hypothetical protein
MIRTTPKVASITPATLLATADTEAVSMIAMVMAIRVRVCFLKVYTSFVVWSFFGKGAYYHWLSSTLIVISPPLFGPQRTQKI